MISENDIRRFKSKYIVDENGCWIWTAHLNYAGYGHFGFAGKIIRAHRFSWMLHKGKISAGLFVLHRCDCRSCVNPDHLWLGSQAENLRDMHNKGRCNPPKGSRAALAKLTETDVLEIRRRANSGEPYAPIAADFNVSESRISLIKNRREWKHV